MRNLILLFLVTITNSFAQSSLRIIEEAKKLKLSHYSIINESLHWAIITYEEDNKTFVDIVELEGAPRVLLHYPIEVQNQYFVEAKTFEIEGSAVPYLALVIGHGAHGQSVFIFDIKNSKTPMISHTPIYSRSSSWPLQLYNRGDYLEILLKGDNNEKTLLPEEISVQWSPSKVTEKKSI